MKVRGMKPPDLSSQRLFRDERISGLRVGVTRARIQ